MHVKDYITCTPVVLGPALQYIVQIKRGHTAFLCWVKRVAFARVLSTWLCVDPPAALSVYQFVCRTTLICVYFWMICISNRQGP